MVGQAAIDRRARLGQQNRDSFNLNIEEDAREAGLATYQAMSQPVPGEDGQPTVPPITEDAIWNAAAREAEISSSLMGNDARRLNAEKTAAEQAVAERYRKSEAIAKELDENYVTNDKGQLVQPGSDVPAPIEMIQARDWYNMARTTEMSTLVNQELREGVTGETPRYGAWFRYWRTFSGQFKGVAVAKGTPVTPPTGTAQYQTPGAVVRNNTGSGQTGGISIPPEP
jgi:hypothetical protein